MRDHLQENLVLGCQIYVWDKSVKKSIKLHVLYNCENYSRKRKLLFCFDRKTRYSKVKVLDTLVFCVFVEIKFNVEPRISLIKVHWLVEISVRTKPKIAGPSRFFKITTEKDDAIYIFALASRPGIQ